MHVTPQGQSLVGGGSQLQTLVAGSTRQIPTVPFASVPRAPHGQSFGGGT
jgi:hypothetical protein